jgi:hypothetical protein
MDIWDDSSLVTEAPFLLTTSGFGELSPEDDKIPMIFSDIVSDLVSMADSTSLNETPFWVLEGPSFTWGACVVDI